MSEYADVRQKQLTKLGVDFDPHLRAVRYILTEIDPVEVLSWRSRQCMELGRYGRQSVLQWDTVPLLDFLRYHSDLVKLIDNENTRSSGAMPGED